MVREIPKLLNEDDAAALLGVEATTLAVWRCTKRYGLAYVRVGRLIRYKESDLLDFLESRRVMPGQVRATVGRRSHRSPDSAKAAK